MNRHSFYGSLIGKDEHGNIAMVAIIAVLLLIVVSLAVQ